MSHRIRVTGDILKAFSVEIDFVRPAIECTPDDEDFKLAVAQELGLRRYDREEGLDIGDFVEFDEQGNEISDPRDPQTS